MPYKDLVHRQDLVAEVTALFDHFGAERQTGETFGDFCRRIGVEALAARAEVYLARQARAPLPLPAGAIHMPTNGNIDPISGHTLKEEQHAGYSLSA